MTRALAPLGLAVLALLSGPTPTHAQTSDSKLLLVLGAPGEAEFATNFLREANLWKEACSQSGCPVVTIGSCGEAESGASDVETLNQALANENKDGKGILWLVLIGHGTFDGKVAKFNLRGPDFTATELAEWLRPFRRPLVVVATASSSAPFLGALSGTNRTILTATRSGNEQNYTRFGSFLVEALLDPQSDLDKDQQVSLLEAFLAGSRRTAEFYKSEGRIATEHALLDDNGDGLGTQADWFKGLRPVKKAKDSAAVDGLRAQQVHLLPGGTERDWSPDQRAQRDVLEQAVLSHRERKSQLPEEDYYRELEVLLLKLARFYASNAVPKTNSPAPPAKASEFE